MLRTLLTTTAFAAMLATGAIAQDTTTAPATEAPAAASTDATMSADAATSSILATGYTVTDKDNLATEIIGQQVYSSDAADAEHIGDVNDLVVGPAGEVAAVVIGVGGFLGIGEKNVAVNFSELQWVVADDNTKRFVLPTSKEALESAPDFVAQDQTMENTNNTTVPVDQSQPATTAPADTMTPAPADGAMAPADGTMAPADGTMAPADNTMAPADNTMAPADGTAAPADNTMAPADNTMAPADGATMIDRSTLNDVAITTDELKGTTAYGPSGEDLGKVGDVVLAADGKTVEAVIIDFGGFLGIGTKPVAVGFDTLKFQADANNNRYVYLNVTRDQLDAAPAFDADTYKTDPANQRLVVSN